MDSASDPDQEYIYFMGSETLPSACYILSDESSIPFYSTSNGYNYNNQINNNRNNNNHNILEVITVVKPTTKITIAPEETQMPKLDLSRHNWKTV